MVTHSPYQGYVWINAFLSLPMLDKDYCIFKVGVLPVYKKMMAVFMHKTSAK